MITCIVVDDSRGIVEGFSDILCLLGLEVVGKGYDGMNAVNLYKEHRPNIIFCDVNMPKYDGFYAVEKIKDFDPDAKIVIVTADFTLETQQRMKDICVTAMIYKPFDQSEIRRVEEHQIKIR